MAGDLLMADVTAVPGELNITLYRGDTTSIELTLTENSAPKVLPATGWLAQIKQKVGSEVLAEFEVDATNAATGVLVLIAPDTSTIVPRKCVWDLQNLDNGATRTYVAGVVNLEGQVSIP